MLVELLPLPGGTRARAYVLPEEASGAQCPVQWHAIVVPGNPGIGAFYQPFALRLHARLQGRVSVRCVDLAGFTKEEDLQGTTVVVEGDTRGAQRKEPQGKQQSGTRRPYSLHDQCAWLHTYLRSLQLQLLAADELACSPPSPATAYSAAAASAVPLLSPHLRPACHTRGGTGTCTGTGAGRREHRFILLGHSIGSFLLLDVMRRCKEEEEQVRRMEGKHVAPPTSALEALAAFLSSPDAASVSPGTFASLPALSVSHSFLLFPFIRMDLPWLHFHALRMMLSLRWLPALLARLARMMPLALYRTLMRLFQGISSGHAVRSVYDMATSRRMMEQFAYLGHTEFRDVLKPAPTAALDAVATKSAVTPYFSPSFLSAHLANTTLYYAGGEADMWGPLSQMRDFQRCMPGIDARLVPKATHAWCAYVDQSSLMAQLIAPEVDKLQLRELQKQGLTLATPQPPLQLHSVSPSVALSRL